MNAIKGNYLAVGNRNFLGLLEMQGDISLRMRTTKTRPCIQTHVDMGLNKYAILIKNLFDFS